MNILAGGPARETESDLFLLHREGLEAQGDVEIRHEIVPDPGGPRWNPEKIERVAKVRQRFMDHCDDDCPCTKGRETECMCDTLPVPPARSLFMVDTDVICGPGVLDRMLEVDADVVFGVFTTKCSWGGPWGDWPQVWTRHPYGFDTNTAKLLVEPGVNEVEVFGGGACTLIRGRGFESRYWPLLDSLQGAPGMWGGEDRSFCLGCETRGIRMVAVTGLPIVHLHADHSPLAVREARIATGLFDGEPPGSEILGERLPLPENSLDKA